MLRTLIEYVKLYFQIRKPPGKSIVLSVFPGEVSQRIRHDIKVEMNNPRFENVGWIIIFEKIRKSSIQGKGMYDIHKITNHSSKLYFYIVYFTVPCVIF